MSEADFVKRFATRLVQLAGEHDDGSGSIETYANTVAKTYYEEDWQREDGPEACAESEFSCWEAE